jgi:hypothetical protein
VLKPGTWIASEVPHQSVQFSLATAIAITLSDLFRCHDLIGSVSNIIHS